MEKGISKGRRGEGEKGRRGEGGEGEGRKCDGKCRL